MSEQTCPNGCDLATFGTHAGPPDCDLQPADPGARLVTALVRVGGREQRAEVALPSSSRPPVDEAALAELVAPVPLLHAFPELARREPVEFAPAEPAAVVVRLPDTASIPPAVMHALDELSRACREAYGGPVEVIPDDRDDVYAALDLIRRHVDR